MTIRNVDLDGFNTGVSRPGVKAETSIDTSALLIGGARDQTQLVVRARPTVTTALASVTIAHNIATIITAADHQLLNGETVLLAALTTYGALNGFAVVLHTGHHWFSVAFVHVDALNAAETGTVTVTQSQDMLAVLDTTGTTQTRIDKNGLLAVPSVSSDNLVLPITIATPKGVIFAAAHLFVHNFNGTFLGLDAGNLTSAGVENVGIGDSVLSANTTGAKNVSVGYQAGKANTTGIDNVGIGWKALNSNTTGLFNTAVGAAAQQYLTTGSYNTSIGRMAAGDGVITGSSNVAIGVSALQKLAGGSNNIAIGYGALNALINANHNTAIGDSAGVLLVGSGNTVVGDQVLAAGVAAANNTAMGLSALGANIAGANNVALGNYAGHYELGSNALYIDNQNRTNTAGDKADAIIYGVMDAARLNQVLKINAILGPLEHVTAGGPAYQEGFMYYDTTNHKLMVGGAAKWEVVTSV